MEQEKSNKKDISYDHMINFFIASLISADSEELTEEEKQSIIDRWDVYAEHIKKHPEKPFDHASIFTGVKDEGKRNAIINTFKLLNEKRMEEDRKTV